MLSNTLLLVIVMMAGGQVAPQVTPAQPDFTKPFMGIDRTVGDVRVLTLLWDPHRPDDPAPSREAVKQLMFGAEKSVRGFFRENSLSRLHLVNAGVYGWYDSRKPADHYWGPPDEGDQDGDGWVNGHVEKWAEALSRVDPEVDFAKYDTNGDGVLEPQELAIHIVIPQNGPFGTNRQPAGREAPEWRPLVVDGVQVPVIAESYIGSPPDLSLVAHELSHLLLNTPDEYFPFRCDTAPGPFSLMDQNWYCGHLDPFLKLRLGWARPRFITEAGQYRLASVEKTGQVLVLWDPAHSASEYFLVENRWPEATYESTLPDQGLAIWHIVDDMNTLGVVPSPPGCTGDQWATIGADDWGRRALRMVRPMLGDDTKALWDGAEEATGYDLLPTSPFDGRATLMWYDGTPSPFSILDIPEAAPVVTVTVKK